MEVRMLAAFLICVPVVFLGWGFGSGSSSSVPTPKPYMKTNTPALTLKCTGEGLRGRVNRLCAIQILKHDGGTNNDAVLATVDNQGARLSSRLQGAHVKAGSLSSSRRSEHWLELTFVDVTPFLYGGYFCRVLYLQDLMQIEPDRWTSDKIYFIPDSPKLDSVSGFQMSQEERPYLICEFEDEQVSNLSHISLQYEKGYGTTLLASWSAKDASYCSEKVLCGSPVLGTDYAALQVYLIDIACQREGTLRCTVEVKGADSERTVHGEYTMPCNDVVFTSSPKSTSTSTESGQKHTQSGCTTNIIAPIMSAVGGVVITLIVGTCIVFVRRKISRGAEAGGKEEYGLRCSSNASIVRNEQAVAVN
ncbi:hypothetical protein BaRGS_00023036 [Batillaria attramentaria]|uniref:Uncharacterized protein n=1 Tax=Batillaria attramentaria TaxID=370345 RepID=A0ABD0KFH2_9CAEN